MNKQKGFSLLELMIICTIIGIMTVVALVYISKSSRSGKEVEFAAREVAVAIREAQNNALGGKQPDAGTVACGMGLYTDNDGTGYKIFYNTKSNPGDDCDSVWKNYVFPQSGIVAQYELGNGVQFSNSDKNKSVYFIMPHGAVCGNNGQLLPANGNFSLQVGKEGANYYICVYPSGNVIESKTGC